MKKILLIITAAIISFLYFIPANAQTDSLTLLKKKDSVIAALNAKLDAASKASVPPATKDTTVAKTSSECTSCCAKSDLGWRQWLLVFLPVLFVILLGYYLIKWIKKDGFKLADALCGGTVTRMETVSKPDPQNAGATVQTDVPVTAPVPSVSRLIAFITGVAAVIIAVCLVTYFAYFAIAECKPQINYDQLWKILAGLGIGVVPYGINVWNKNTKEDPATGK